MNWANAAWWVIYACFGIILQGHFPGIDFLLPGFIIAIQERKIVQLVWVLIFFLLLQEGMGSMAFGGTLLWYLLVIVMFFLGFSLFEVESFLFIFLLSGCLGAIHATVFSLMSNLQDIPININMLLEKSVIQSITTPFIWRVAHYSRRFVNHEDSA